MIVFKKNRENHRRVRKLSPITLLFLVFFLSVHPAFATCPSGTTLNGNVCQARPTCSSGTFISSNHNCESVIGTVPCPHLDGTVSLGYCGSCTYSHDSTLCYESCNNACADDDCGDACCDTNNYSTITYDGGASGSTCNSQQPLSACPSGTTYQTGSTCYGNPIAPTCPPTTTLNISDNMCEINNQTITFSTPPTQTYGNTDFPPGATANSGLTVSYTSSNTSVATIINGNIHIVGAGTSAITAIQAGNSNYAPAANVTQTLTVNPPTCPSGTTFNGSVCQASPTCSSGTFISSNHNCESVIGTVPCPHLDGTVSLGYCGSCTYSHDSTLCYESCNNACADDDCGDACCDTNNYSTITYDGGASGSTCNSQQPLPACPSGTTYQTGSTCYGNPTAPTCPPTTTLNISDNMCEFRALSLAVNISRGSIDSSAGETATIFVSLNGPATVTLQIAPEAGGSTVYTASQSCPATGCIFTWDGKQTSGQYVPSDAYLYTLTASDGITTRTYNPAKPTGASYIACSTDSSFDPYKNVPLDMPYDLSQTARVNLWGLDPSQHRIPLLNNIPQVAGHYQFEWNGRNDQDMIIANGVTAGCSATLLAENVIITTGDTPRISELRVDPYAINLSYGEFSQIQFGVQASSGTTVTVKLKSPAGTEIQLLNSSLSAGNNTVALKWPNYDGNIGNQFPVSQQSIYTLTVQAVSTSGKTNIQKRVLQVGY